jgi:hypothetical protein
MTTSPPTQDALARITTRVREFADMIKLFGTNPTDRHERSITYNGRKVHAADLYALLALATPINGEDREVLARIIAPHADWGREPSARFKGTLTKIAWDQFYVWDTKTSSICSANGPGHSGPWPVMDTPEKSVEAAQALNDAEDSWWKRAQSDALTKADACLRALASRGGARSGNVARDEHLRELVQADLDILRQSAEQIERRFDNASKVAATNDFGAKTAEECAKTADAIRTAIVELATLRSLYDPLAASPPLPVQGGEASARDGEATT